MKLLMNADNGYGVTKIFDGESTLEIPSLYCNYESNLILHEPSHTKDFLAAEIKSKSNNSLIIKNVIVGDKARIGRAKFNFKSDLPNTLYPTMIGLALLLIQKNIPEAEVDITTTLTIDDFKNSININKFKEIFCREWSIKFLHGDLKDKECKIKITDNMTISQCSAGIWDYILNGNSLLKNRKILGIDIGFETTDIVIMNGMVFEDNNSFTLPAGISDYNQKIIMEVNNKFGVKKSLEDADIYVRTNKFGNNDISNIITNNYKKLVKEIIDGITIVAPTTHEFTDIILMGGGGIKTLDLFREYENFKNIKLLNHPQLSNVFGSRKLSKIVWRERTYANI
jgi:hypothetical protein